MVSEQARKLNYFQVKHGVSKHYSPCMILHQENIDYHRHCQFTFGEYILGYDEPLPTNTNVPHALDFIYLRPTSNHQGGHDLLHLQTNSVVNCWNCTPMSLTKAIIQQVHKIAEMDKMP